MAQADGLIPTLISPNARKRFVQSISATTTSAPTTLNASTEEGDLIPKGAMWILQPATDMRYDIRSTARTITSTNAVKVLADQQEYVQVRDVDGSTTPASTTGGTRPILSLKAETTTGAVNVFVTF